MCSTLRNLFALLLTAVRRLPNPVEPGDGSGEVDPSKILGFEINPTVAMPGEVVEMRVYTVAQDAQLVLQPYTGFDAGAPVASPDVVFFNAANGVATYSYTVPADAELGTLFFEVAVTGYAQAVAVANSITVQ